jgi:hypothetical protein
MSKHNEQKESPIDLNKRSEASSIAYWQIRRKLMHRAASAILIAAAEFEAAMAKYTFAAL